MARITILSDIICNQIAAGEVVERPAAVVKELLENSIDAGASKVFLAILQGGRKEIRVTDNGVGMCRDDALLAIERHATSKIKSIQDLQSIRSLGFRGEALPSIAAVSRFELITRESDAPNGICLRLDGGILREVRDTGCPAGTTITVRDLFYNMPVRRKFLRSVDTEIAHISDQVMRLAIAHSQIHFTLMHQDRVLFDFTSVTESFERIGQVLGWNLARQLRPFTAQRPSMNINGWMSLPALQRSSGTHLWFYINSRPIWDRLLNRAVMEAYENIIPRGRYPLVVLFIDVPPELVDVNVHPTKREVRFRNPGEMLELVRETLRKCLEATVSGKELPPAWFPPPRHLPGMPSTGLSQETQLNLQPTEVGLKRNRESYLWSPGGFKINDTTENISIYKDEIQHQPETESPSERAPFFSRCTYLGQLANSYILLEDQDGLVLIDQHAAHERIIFDRLSAKSSQEPQQRLARPVVIQLLPKEAAKMRNLLNWLQRVGFEIEPFGTDAFVLNSVPAVLSECPPEETLRDFVQNVSDDAPPSEVQLLVDLIKTRACHSAIKARQKLTVEEVKNLLKSLDETAIPSTCPHGRPVWIKLSLHQLAYLFQRA